jgi:hypothetical protein
MKYLPFLLMLIIGSCSPPGKEKVIGNLDSTSINSTTTVDDDSTSGKAIIDAIPPVEQIDPADEKPKLAPKVYANKRFRDVTVEKIAANKYRVKGKGQIFEAAFSWVVEDGHNELKQGHEMTDAGAPEWGNFNFVVEVAKQRPNSTLHLIIYETSAKDGSRQYLLPIKLE